MPLFLFTRHLDGAKRLVSPVKSPAFIACDEGNSNPLQAKDDDSMMGW